MPKSEKKVVNTSNVQKKVENKKKVKIKDKDKVGDDIQETIVEKKIDIVEEKTLKDGKKEVKTTSFWSKIGSFVKKSVDCCLE